MLRSDPPGALARQITSDKPPPKKFVIPKRTTAVSESLLSANHWSIHRDHDLNQLAESSKQPSVPPSQPRPFQTIIRSSSHSAHVSLCLCQGVCQRSLPVPHPHQDAWVARRTLVSVLASTGRTVGRTGDCNPCTPGTFGETSLDKIRRPRSTRTDTWLIQPLLARPDNQLSRVTSLSFVDFREGKIFREGMSQGNPTDHRGGDTRLKDGLLGSSWREEGGITSCQERSSVLALVRRLLG